MGMMGCCGGGKAVSDDKPEPESFFFKKRGCTDLCCFIFFFLWWAVCGYITYLSIAAGEPLSVFYGQDYLGNRCGVGTMASKPKVYFPRIDQDLIEQSAIAATMPWKVRFYGLCLEACPNISSPQQCFADPASCQVHDYGTAAEYTAAGGSASYFATMPSLDFINRCIPTDSSSMTQAPDRCAFPQCDGVNYAPCDPDYPTTWQMSFPASLNCDVVFRVGKIEQLRPASISTMTDAISGNVATLVRIVEGIAGAYTEILIFGLALPVVLGFLWLVLLRLFAGIFTYIMIIAIGCVLLLLTLYLYLRAGALGELLAALSSNSTALPFGTNGTAVLNDTLSQVLGFADSAETAIAQLAPSGLTSLASDAENEVPALWWILAVIMSIITLVYIISMCVARKQIRTAIALVKEGANVIKDR